jgi:probable DNA metabolism protein
MTNPIPNSLLFVYDHTIEGLLTAVFDAFARKQTPDKIVASHTPLPLFTDTHHIVTDATKAERVLAGLRKKISPSAIRMLFACFLYETDEVDTCIFRYILKAFNADRSIELNFADPDVLALSKIYRKVMREEERVRQFVRFQKTVDGLFFACIEPAYNVLLLTKDFFETRFADQPWLIYDVRRKYGLYYNLRETSVVHFPQPLFSTDTGQLSPEQMDNCEIDFQHLWQQYFRSATIHERINPKLQRQFMPKRFWKYLTEKNNPHPSNNNCT